jgi:hypothetical protein
MINGACIFAQNYNARVLSVDIGLPNNKIYNILEDSKGFIWFGTSNGVCRWDSKNFDYFTIKDGLPNNEVLSIFEDSKGRIWFSTFSDELCYYFEGEIFNGKTNSNLAKIKVEYSTPLVELDSILYANHTIKQCIKINLNNFESSVTANPPHISNTIAYKKQLFHLSLLSSLKSQDDSILFFRTLTTRLGYRSYKPSALSKFLDSVISPKYNQAKLLEQTKEYYLKESNDKLFYVADKNLMLLKSPSIARLAEDDILRIFLHKGISYLNYKKEIHVLNSSKLIHKFDNNTLVYNIGKGTKTSILTTGTKLYNLATLSEIKLPKHTSLKYYYYDKFSNEEFLGIANGLYRLKHDSLYNLSEKRTYSILIDKDRTLWFSGIDKLYFAAKYSPKIKDEKELVLDTNVKVFVHQIQQDKYGHLIFTSNNGIYFFNPKTKSKFHLSENNFLISNECRKLVIDPKDNTIWIATLQGLHHLGYTKTAQGISFYSINRFFADDGLYSNEINDIFIYGDSVYIATSKGLNLLYNKTYRPSSISIPIYINKLFVNGIERDINHTKLKLSSDENNLEIDFSAIYFQRRDRLMIKYRLIKDGDTTVNIVKSNRLQFLALEDGDYKLELFAFDQDYPFIKSPTASLQFKIKPPFYKSSWFWIIMFISSFTLVGFYLYRKMLNKKNKALQEAETHSKINEYALKSLQNQMNPHFVFNSLNTMQHLMVSHQDEAALYFLSDFSELMREMLNQSRNEFIHLEDEINFLKKYIHLEQIRFEQKFKVEWKLDIPEVQFSYIKLPCMLIQPIIENAIKHGVNLNREQEGYIQISVSVNAENSLTFIVKNTRFSLRENPTRGNNMAIKVIRERLMLYSKNGQKGSFDLIIKDKEAIATLIIPI